MRAHPYGKGLLRPSVWALAAVLAAATFGWSQPEVADWQQQVRESVRLHQLNAALTLVNERLTLVPTDLEARGWHGRLLAWLGRWGEAEADYRTVLDRAPNDTEILCGLGDVLLWEGKPKEALAAVDRALALAGNQTDILLRRARILQAMGDTPAARRVYHEVLILHPENQDPENQDPQNQQARQGLAGLAQESKHEFRVTGDLSTFSSTNAAEDEVLALTSHWTPKIATAFTAGMYQRFGKNASEFAGSTSVRLTKSDSLTLGAAVARDQGIIPKNEAFFEYGHGLHFTGRWVKGAEVSYRQRWLWYRGAHVLMLGGTQIYYLPREWTWSFTLNGARSGFAGSGIEWVPSGSTRLDFPLPHRFRGNVSFANGTEDFAQVDQIGHFSARTFGGGLKYRLASAQDIAGYVAAQSRSNGQTQNSFGASYAFRF